MVLALSSYSKIHKSLSSSIPNIGIMLGLLAAPGYALPADFGLRAPAQVETLLQTPVHNPQVKSDSPSDKSLTVPGLWWANQQFGDKMVQDWFAYRHPEDRSSQVRAIIRPDLWSRYTYLERYAFLKRFGATSSAAGYHLLVLDRQNYLLGAYTCEFSNQVQPAPLSPWEQRLAPLASPPIKAPCSVWISPVYGSESF